jgi:plasmid maintenance system antidote protein VapI
VNTWQPDWVTCPGETLAELLETTQMPVSVFQADAAHYLPAETVAGILAGTEPVTVAHADVLAHHTGVPVPFWCTLEHLYRTGLARGCVHPHDD